MAMSTTMMRAHLGNVAAFAPSRPAVRRARVLAPVRAEKSLGDKIQEKTDVSFHYCSNALPSHPPWVQEQHLLPGDMPSKMWSV